MKKQFNPTHAPAAATATTDANTGRHVELLGWVSAYNTSQILAILEVGDSVATTHPMTARTLFGLVQFVSYEVGYEVDMADGVTTVWRVL